MHVRIISLAQKEPLWVKLACNEYLKRFKKNIHFDLLSIPTVKRTGTINVNAIKQKEANKILSLVDKNTMICALEIKGHSLSTEQLAEKISNWQTNFQRLDFIIGGPDGLAKELLDKSHFKWSLSPLTFPHLLARIIVIEQIYRAISILEHHPYHRG